jgi:hypothetical protein
LSTFVYFCTPFHAGTVSLVFKGLRHFFGPKSSTMTLGAAGVLGGQAQRFDFDGVYGSGGGCP